jgi:hypothetical protein
MRLISSALLLSIALPVVSAAQTDTLSLAGRSNLMLGIGLAGERSATASTSQASVTRKGEAASFSFNHWVRPELGILVSASMLGSSATAGFGRGGAAANAIFPILFGLSYSPRALALSPSIRPFVSAAAGPYVYTAAGATTTAAENYSETALGSRLGAGANWFVARHFTVLVEANYHAIGKFERQDAVTRDPSGFGLNVGFGFAWGNR